KDAGSQLKSVVPFLFFSKQDGYVAVANSATTAINECFPSEEKQQLAVDTFGGDVVAVCLQILSKTHKLVAPQKFTEEETDVQRQTRLIAQSINTLESFIECAPGLFETIGPQFASSATFNSLMNMDPAVKAAAFRLLKKLVQKDVKLILGTRIPSYILQNLSAEDILLCRNVFECFLVAGANPQFFEACKVDKAVIPKMLNLVRKKGL
uniref:E3 ubiquitin-protein ligase listerin n=1 Tax=Panagrolaimus sp. JU765 TaxID=591449 RepID=A0AC34Q8F7_9BILA